MGSLYEDLGGDVAVQEVVDRLYARVLADHRLAPFFDGIDIVDQRRKFRAFMNTVTGGPFRRSILELRTAHARPVSQGMTDEHFDAFMGHFRTALDESDAPPLVIHALMNDMARFRNAVLDL